MNPKNFVLLLALACSALTAVAANPNLTAYERSQGWLLLGEKSDWRAFAGNKFPANWTLSEGSLRGQTGAALVSATGFKDFELQFACKVSAGGSGAVFFRIDEDAGSVEQSGPHMQLAGGNSAMGGNGLSAPDRQVTPQFEVWYQAKIVVFGNAVEHWINGERVMSYTIDTPEWRTLVTQSTAATQRKDFGKLREGPIALSGDGVEFRSVKIRAL